MGEGVGAGKRGWGGKEITLKKWEVGEGYPLHPFIALIDYF